MPSHRLKLVVALLHLGQALEETQRADEAIPHYREALRLAEQQPDATLAAEIRGHLAAYAAGRGPD